VELHPTHCDYSGATLEDPLKQEKGWRHQVVNLPEIQAKVTEYRPYCMRCNGRWRASAMMVSIHSGVPHTTLPARESSSRGDLQPQ